MTVSNSSTGKVPSSDSCVADIGGKSVFVVRKMGDALAAMFGQILVCL